MASGGGRCSTFLLLLAAALAFSAWAPAPCRAGMEGVHMVGDKLGWAPNINYTGWGNTSHFYVGDWLGIVIDSLHPSSLPFFFFTCFFFLALIWEVFLLDLLLFFSFFPVKTAWDLWISFLLCCWWLFFLFLFRLSIWETSGLCKRWTITLSTRCMNNSAPCTWFWWTMWCSALLCSFFFLSCLMDFGADLCLT